ncbi:hypothetical protein D3C84_815400 [compost metagenome]
MGQSAILLLPGHDLGECAKGRCFEQQAQVQLQSEFFAQPRNHLGGRNGVAAEQEEMIIRADLLDLQLLTPDLSDQGLQLGSGFAVAGAFSRHRRKHCIAVEAAVRQAIAARRALQLAAGRLGQCARI